MTHFSVAVRSSIYHVAVPLSRPSPPPEPLAFPLATLRSLFKASYQDTPTSRAFLSLRDTAYDGGSKLALLPAAYSPLSPPPSTVPSTSSFGLTLLPLPLPDPNTLFILLGPGPGPARLAGSLRSGILPSKPFSGTGLRTLELPEAGFRPRPNPVADAGEGPRSLNS